MVMLHTLVICIIFFQSVELRSIKIKVDSKEESLAFRLIHINDIHAHFDQVNEHTGRCKAEDAASNSCFGGIARVKTAVDGIRNLKPDMESIFLNAGDYYQVIINRYQKIYAVNNTAANNASRYLLLLFKCQTYVVLFSLYTKKNKQ